MSCQVITNNENLNGSLRIGTMQPSGSHRSGDASPGHRQLLSETKVSSRRHESSSRAGSSRRTSKPTSGMSRASSVSSRRSTASYHERTRSSRSSRSTRPVVDKEEEEEKEALSIDDLRHSLRSLRKSIVSMNDSIVSFSDVSSLQGGGDETPIPPFEITYNPSAEAERERAKAHRKSETLRKSRSEGTAPEERRSEGHRRKRSERQSHRSRHDSHGSENKHHRTSSSGKAPSGPKSLGGLPESMSSTSLISSSTTATSDSTRSNHSCMTDFSSHTVPEEAKPQTTRPSLRPRSTNADRTTTSSRSSLSSRSVDRTPSRREKSVRSSSSSSSSSLHRRTVKESSGHSRSKRSVSSRSVHRELSSSSSSQLKADSRERERRSSRALASTERNSSSNSSRSSHRERMRAPSSLPSDSSRELTRGKTPETPTAPNEGTVCLDQGTKQRRNVTFSPSTVQGEEPETTEILPDERNNSQRIQDDAAGPTRTGSSDTGAKPHNSNQSLPIPAVLQSSDSETVVSELSNFSCDVHGMEQYVRSPSIVSAKLPVSIEEVEEDDTDGMDTEPWVEPSNPAGDDEDETFLADKRGELIVDFPVIRATDSFREDVAEQEPMEEDSSNSAISSRLHAIAEQNQRMEMQTKERKKFRLPFQKNAHGRGPPRPINEIGRRVAVMKGQWLSIKDSIKLGRRGNGSDTRKAEESTYEQHGVVESQNSTVLIRPAN